MENSLSPVTGMPRQTVSYRQKTDEWAKKCVNSVENISGVRGSNMRKSRRNKIVNYNLFDGHVDRDDMEQLLNPDGFEDSTISTSIQHNPIIISKFNVLIGEEATRRFEPQVIVTNPDAVSEKEYAMREQGRQKVLELLNNPEMTDEQKQQAYKRFAKYLRYEFQDQREVRANRILRYLSQELRLKKKFNDGFTDALICGEEIYEIESFKSLEFNKLNPKNIHTVMSGESNRIEDADIIVIESYRSPGQLIDRYVDDLKQKDVKKLEQMTTNLDPGGPDFVDASQYVTFYSADTDGDGNALDSLIDLTELHNDTLFGHYQDSSGNLRELRVLWRSRRKMKKITYPNPITGELEEKYMPETYQVDPSLGESEKVLWVNEWWEGTKIGRDIYVRLQPKKTQYFRMENPSQVHPGIVGTIYNTNGGRATSMMDRVKSYQYLYDAIWDNLKEALRTNLGPIMEMDMAKVPDSWSFEKWLFYVKKMRIAAVDSFKVGNKGPATGTLAGNFNTSGKVMNMDLGNYIQQMVGLLQFIETQLSIVTGVTPQREGQIQNRETVGGVERSVAQSSAITERLFFEHEETMIRATRYLVEAAKDHYRGKKFKAQYFLDDGSIEMLNMDGDQFADADYDVVAVSGTHIQQLRQNMQQMAQAGLQNELIGFSTLLDIWMAPSIQDMRRSIEAAEQEKIERDQKNFEMTEETKKKISSDNLQDKQEERQHEWRQAVLKSDTEIEKAHIMAEGFGYEDNEEDIQKLEEKRNSLLTDIRNMQVEIEKGNEKRKQIELETTKVQTRKKRATQSAGDSK